MWLKMGSNQDTQNIRELQKSTANLEKITALMQQDIEYIKKGQDELKDVVNKIVYPSMELFNKLEARVSDLEEENKKNTLGTVFANLLANKAFTVVASAIIGVALWYIITKGSGIK